MTPIFTSGGVTIRHRAISTWAPFVALVVLATWGARSDAGQEEVPRRPPEPFLVFVHTSDPADAALKANLQEAMPMVRERMERRGDWFRSAGSANTAEITLRIVNYRTGELRDHPHRGTGGMMPGMLIAEPSDCQEYHFVDAVARGGGVSAKLSGLDAGTIGGGGLRRAAGQLAKELERFAKDNYGSLSQRRTRIGPKEPGDGSAAPRSRNASPSRD